MAFSKKNKRRITVDSGLFYWSATGSDGWIGLMIMSEVEGSGKVPASFDYHHIETPLNNQWNTVIPSDQFVITPYIVHQVVQLALQEGWEPFQKSSDFPLGHVDDKVDPRFDQNRAKRSPQAF